MDIFEECKKINSNIELNNDDLARNNLILLLDYMKKNDIKYSPIVNHLIRKTGLYPYIDIENAILEDRLVYDAFKVDTGENEPLTLHREQSNVLKKLLDGKNLAISAPTSFGKSFVIDSFISIKKPNNILIIVPTIALTDELRRRIYKKFSHEYKIITTTDVELSDKNIFIFPQERAIGYIDSIKQLDLLVIDEFYKASFDFDKERSPALQKVILKLGKKSKQKYYLAPNIEKLNANLFTDNMEFLPIKFNTVYLSIHEIYNDITKSTKNTKLIEILKQHRNEKTLIYAGTYTEIDMVSELVKNSVTKINLNKLNQFSMWLSKNYEENWNLTHVVKKGMGIHNGRLHRSLSQIQIKLFEDIDGLNNIVSTSSIIEGINTSAQNVILWKNKDGTPKLNSFKYKNVIGRGGRMFKHFVGNVYLLDKPPVNDEIELNIDFPESIIPAVDEEEYKNELTKEQISKIIEHKDNMYQILGKDVYNQLLKEDVFQSKRELIEKIAKDMKENPDSWNGLSHLNNIPDKWDNPLYKVLKLKLINCETNYNNFVEFIKVLSLNWSKSIPELITSLSNHSIKIDMFFQLERNATFKLAILLSDINILQRIIFKSKNIDISPFISKLSHAFLPSVVYQLEEYGLPRMLSKKIHQANIIDFTEENLNIHLIIDKFNELGIDYIKEQISTFDEFDLYILDYFYDGISNKSQRIIK
ncbi:DEAD/DEAH box helicase [Aliarcobacter butzleri]|uniref:DEAD/DEAH box helicase n=1 Tax=Aliarcobacter butzleri TaxID=28197 RepID=UPI0012FAE6AB|nr:DEAD/DEAH box helicase [Aliarcobacter butzleri]